DITYSDADVRNEIVAVHEGQNQTLRHVARDDNAASPTSIPRIGRRTEVVRAPLSDAISKLRVFAQRILSELSRATLPATARIPAGEVHDAGEVWRVIEPRTGTDALFLLTSYSLSASREQAIYDIDAQLEAV